MRIECTSGQKELLINLIVYDGVCVHETRPVSAKCEDAECRECLNRNIKWEIYNDDDGQKESEGTNHG